MDEFCKGRLACIKAIIRDGSNRISREEERIIQAGRDIVEFYLVYEDVRLAGLSLSLGDGHLHPRLTREWEKVFADTSMIPSYGHNRSPRSIRSIRTVC